MALPREIRKQIEKQDFDTVESDWLEKVETAPEDVRHFNSVARALVGAGQADTAKMLLDLLDDELQEADRWTARLELLRKTGKIQHPPSKLHAMIVETLRRIYADTSALEQLMETVALHRSSNDIDKVWDKVGRLESLIRYDKGTVVYMTGKGVGRVTEVNQKLESFKVEIGGKGALRVGFRAAPKMLEALPEEHILARKVNDPESLSDLGPGDLLAETLQCFDRPLTAAEVRDALHGLVSTAKWNSWWTAARKHPQIIASADVRNAYQWVESNEDARGATWKRFDNASPRGKLDLLNRAGAKDEKLRERMSNTLLRLGRDSAATEPGLSFEIWLALEKWGLAPEEEWSPHRLVEQLADPLRLLASIDSRTAREKAYVLIRELRDDWRQLYRDALINESGAKLLAHLANALQEVSTDTYRRAIERCLAQPSRAGGFFTWLAENAAEDEEELERLGIRLFKKILFAISTEELSPYRSRLLKLCESGGTLPRLLPHLDDKGAREAEQVLIRAAGISRDVKDLLISAIHLKFPALRQPEETPLYALADTIERKRDELRKLLEEEIPTNRKAIEEARALGDLRENFEYKSARQRHEFLSALATELNEDLGRSQPLDPGKIDASQVRIGTVITLVGENAAEQTITILGPWESSPENRIVSYESEVAAKLLGARKGEQVEVGDETLTISGITAYSA